MFQHSGTRFLIVALLTLLMALPLFMVGSIIDGRLATSREAQREVAAEWAGAQMVHGPQIVVPVTATQITTEARDSNKGGQATQTRTTREVEAAPLVILPETFDLTVHAQSETRKRGVFEVPVYTGAIDLDADFTMPDIDGIIAPNETVHWKDARLRIILSHNKGLRGEAAITANGTALQLEPLSQGGQGLEAMIGDPRNDDQHINGTISLRGADYLKLAPVGRISRIKVTGTWPHPGFTGALPDESQVTASGFAAAWTIPHLARALPQLSRDNDQFHNDNYMDNDDFPVVRFLQPNDFYQQAFRATRYAILMIALTFLAVFLAEDRKKRPAHPVQYILIGLSQALFVVLMVAYAEHIGFDLAFLGASAATIALLILFGITALRLGRRTAIMGITLIVLYAVLWLILKSTDYALLAGATLAFLALAATMILTRNENWYGPLQQRSPAGRTGPPPADTSTD